LKNVKSVSNQIEVVKELASFGVVSNDIWITSKVMTTLATTKDIPSRTIVVTTDRAWCTSWDSSRSAKAIWLPKRPHKSAASSVLKKPFPDRDSRRSQKTR